MHKYSILKKYVFSVIIELQRRDSIEFTKDVHSSYDFIFHRLGEEIVFWNSFWSLWLHLMTTSFLEASLYILTSSCLAKVVKWICLFWVPTLPNGSGCEASFWGLLGCESGNLTQAYIKKRATAKELDHCYILRHCLWWGRLMSVNRKLDCFYLQSQFLRSMKISVCPIFQYSRSFEFPTKALILSKVCWEVED